MRQRADRGMFLIIGGAPVDDQTFELGQKHTIEEAIVVANEYVETNPGFFTAEVFDDQKRMVFRAGTI